MLADANARQVASSELNEPSSESDMRCTVIRFGQRTAAAIGEEPWPSASNGLFSPLRQSKWDVDKALERMKKLAAFAEKNAEYFDGQTPEEFVGQAKIGVISHLPTRTANGELVLLIDGPKLKEYAKAFSMRDMMRLSVFYMSHLLHDEATQVHGCIILENLENYPIFALNTMKGMGPTAMKASFDWLSARRRCAEGCTRASSHGTSASCSPSSSHSCRASCASGPTSTARTQRRCSRGGLKAEHTCRQRHGGTMEGFDPAGSSRSGRSLRLHTKIYTTGETS